MKFLWNSQEIGNSPNQILGLCRFGENGIFHLRVGFPNLSERFHNKFRQVVGNDPLRVWYHRVFLVAMEKFKNLDLLKPNSYPIDYDVTLSLSQGTNGQFIFNQIFLPGQLIDKLFREMDRIVQLSPELACFKDYVFLTQVIGTSF